MGRGVVPGASCAAGKSAGDFVISVRALEEPEAAAPSSSTAAHSRADEK